MTYTQYKKALDKEVERHIKQLEKLATIRKQIQDKCKHKHTEYCFGGPYSDSYTICYDCEKIL